MSANQKKYQAFLLRLWQANQNGDRVWRASLEDTRTGERRGFASPEALMEVLLDQTRKKDEEQGAPTKHQGG